MNKIEQLAREATDLHRPGSVAGLVNVMSLTIGVWEVEVHVRNEFARHHCDRWDTDFGVITEQGRDLDTVLDRMIVRVQDAVADTPCEQVPA